MKSIKIIFIGTLLCLIAFSCAVQKPLSNNYEVASIGQGKQGTILVKVFSYGKDVEEATERAKMDAVHAVLFKGVPGSNLRRPLIPDPSVEQSKNSYFLDFFGVDSWNDRSNRKNNRVMRYGSQTAPYRTFVQLSTDGSISASDRLKVPGGYKVGIVVSVNHSQLRRKLEQDNIIRGFGL